MPETTATLDLAGQEVDVSFAGWAEWLLVEMDRNETNGRVGLNLLLETERLRVWSIRLAPGERVPFHRHVLDYVWVATTAGRGRQHIHDGTTRDVEYGQDESRAFGFGPGEFLLHDLENVGQGDLVFVTVEHLDGANEPLALTGGDDA